MGSEHISLCPISVEHLEDDPSNLLPLKISDSLFVEDVSEILHETAFDPLVPQYYSKEEVGGLTKAKYALVRRIECEDGEEPNTRAESVRMLYQFYIGLKAIRPTTGRFQVLHYDMGVPKPRLPAGERNDYATILCDCEILNRVRIKDLMELVKLAPCISRTLISAKNPISQAAQSLEIGYRADFLNVRHLLWVVGLDALFTSTEWKNQGKDVAVGRIRDFLGLDFQIYPEQPFAGFDLPTLGSLLLKDVVEQIYKLRNDFAHGTWPDKQWAGRVCRRSLDPGRDIYYAEQLSEAASATLRGCLRKILSDSQSVEIFSDKAKMNSYFASRGLVRRRKKHHSANP